MNRQTIVEIDVGYDQKTIILEEDYDFVNRYDWILSGNGYVVRFEKQEDIFIPIYLHRELMKVTNSSTYVDHINGYILDNRKSNLRLCDHRENLINRGKARLKRTPTSKFKGVSFDKKSNMWRVRIKSHKKEVFCGFFTDEVAGANAYNHYAKIHFGEFAKLNICPIMSIEEWEKYQAKAYKTSHYKGVSKTKGNKWKVSVWHEGKSIHVGNYETEEEAALRYNEKVIEMKLNKKLNAV